MPTSLLGVALYVFALFPGIAFIFAREGHQPAVKRSALRETASLIFVSAICDAITAFLIVVVAHWWSDLDTRIGETLRGDLNWVRENLLLSLVALVIFAGVATAFGYAAGTQWAHEHGLKFLWNSPIPRDTSGWKALFDERPNNQAAIVEVAVVLKSGGWISGILHTFDNDPDPHPHRTLTLLQPQYRAVGVASPVILTDYVMIEADQIELLQVMYKLPGGTASAAGAVTAGAAVAGTSGSAAATP